MILLRKLLDIVNEQLFFQEKLDHHEDLEKIVDGDDVHYISYQPLTAEISTKITLPRTSIDRFYSKAINHLLIRFLDFLFVLIDNCSNRLALFISDLEERINEKYLTKSKKKYDKRMR